MNNVLQEIMGRRSIRSYSDKPVEQQLLDQIIEAGLYAPSGRGNQDPIIIQVTDPKVRGEIAELNRKIGGWDAGFDPFYGAPAIFVVLGKKDWPLHLYDGSVVIGNMLLAAHSLGLGSCWIHRAKEEFETDWGKALLNSLGIAGEYEGIGHCAVGYIKGDAPQPAVRKDHRVYAVK